MSRGTTLALFAALLVLALLPACAASAATPAHSPQLLLDSSVASDFAAVARETWTLFLQTFHARVACFGDVHLRAALELPDRAAYDPKTATVTVRVPGSAAMLQSALIHEWAHHVEFECPEQQAVRAAFLQAQGLPSDTAWRPAGIAPGESEGEWATIPSEQFAEASIEAVLGRRQIPTSARVSPAAVQVVRLWAAGE